MRLVGTVAIQNRLAYEQCLGARTSNIGRPCKTVLQIRDRSDGRRVLVLSTKKEVGAYEFYTNTIQNLRTKMIKDGLATIEIGQPAWNIMIRDCDPKELEKFLQCIKESRGHVPKKVMETGTKSDSSNGAVVTVTDATGTRREGETEEKPGNLRRGNGTVKRARSPGLTPREAIKVRNCLATNNKIVTIKSRDKYPQEFSSKVETIRVLEIGLRKIDKRWLSLSNLVTLEIKDNPVNNVEALTKMQCTLRTLILVNNKIERFSDEFFSHLSLRHLSHLQISGNPLKRLPPSFEDLHDLIYVDLSSNQLISLPHNWIRLRRLSTLNVSKNRLHFLPQPIATLQLSSLDMSDNEEMNKIPASVTIERFDSIGYNEPISLFEIACVKVMNMYKKDRTRVPTGFPDIIPHSIRAGKYCRFCGELALRYTIHTKFDVSRSLTEGPMSSCLVMPSKSLYMKSIYCYDCDLKKRNAQQRNRDAVLPFR